MITLITLIPFAAFVLALFLRGRRIRRLRAKLGRLEALVADLRRQATDLRSQLARGDQVADRLRGALWLTGLQMAGERRKLRAAEKDAAEWKEIARLQFIRNAEIAEAGNERLVVRPPALGEAVLTGIDMALYELELDQ